MHAFNAHAEGLPLGVSAAGLKTTFRWSKKFDDMRIRLDTIPQRDGQTDRQTDRQTEVVKEYRSLRASAMLTRESKKVNNAVNRSPRQYFA